MIVALADDGLMCQCNEGYEGILCENNIDDCASNPCQNGGQCMDLVNDFQCSCPGNFSGKTCDQVTVDCRLPNCLNCTLINGEPICLQCEEGYYISSNGKCCTS